MINWFTIQIHLQLNCYRKLQSIHWLTNKQWVLLTYSLPNYILLQIINAFLLRLIIINNTIRQITIPHFIQSHLHKGVVQSIKWHTSVKIELFKMFSKIKQIINCFKFIFSLTYNNFENESKLNKFMLI